MPAPFSPLFSAKRAVRRWLRALALTVANEGNFAPRRARIAGEPQPRLKRRKAIKIEAADIKGVPLGIVSLCGNRGIPLNNGVIRLLKRFTRITAALPPPTRYAVTRQWITRRAQILRRDRLGHRLLLTRDLQWYRRLMRDSRIVPQLLEEVSGTYLRGITATDRFNLTCAIAMQGGMIAAVFAYVWMVKTRAAIDPAPVLLLQAIAYFAGAYYTGRSPSINGRFWNNLWALFGLVAFSLNAILWWVTLPP